MLCWHAWAGREDGQAVAGNGQIPLRPRLLIIQDRTPVWAIFPRGTAIAGIEGGRFLAGAWGSWVELSSKFHSDPDFSQCCLSGCCDM
jgi:hypothetical protein